MIAADCHLTPKVRTRLTVLPIRGSQTANVHRRNQSIGMVAVRGLDHIDVDLP